MSKYAAFARNLLSTLPNKKPGLLPPPLLLSLLSESLLRPLPLPLLSLLLLLMAQKAPHWISAERTDPQECRQHAADLAEWPRYMLD